MHEIISKILSGTLYDRGFKIDGKTYPFYSFCQPNSKTGWSDRMTEQIEEPSKNHFIDRYNRKVALDGIRSKLVGENCCYLDMGCSSGYMLEEVFKNFPEVNAIGADYFSAGLLQCRQRLPDIPLFQMDLVNCQFSNNSFDAIRNTKKYCFLENTCYLEQAIWKKINYPFGFRGYAIATK